MFAHKILRLLKSKDLLSDERLQLLLSFRNSGFSVDTSPTVWPQDTQGLERLCRYLLRCPVSISRIHWTPGSRTLFYQSKGSHDDPLLSHPKGESIDIFEFIARVLTQIPEPRKHGVHYFGAYASRSRVLRNKRGLTLHSPGVVFFTLNREDFSFVIHLDRQPRTSRRREAQTGSRARSGSRSERTLDAVEHSRTLMEWWPFLIFHRGGLRIKVINNTW